MDRAFLNGEDGVGHLVLIRHGQQQWPDPDTSVTADWIDPPLSELGEQQAACTGTHLASETIDAVYSSQLARAHDTGRAVAGHHDLDVTVMRELEEIHIFRDLPQDQRASDVLGEEFMHGVRHNFVRTKRWDAYPGTESSLEFRRRVSAAIESILHRHPGQTVAVACHGGVINAYLAEVPGLSEDMFFRPVHASVHRLRFDVDRRVVGVLNEQHHLAAQALVSH